jgi:hypothetical protein
MNFLPIDQIIAPSEKRLRENSANTELYLDIQKHGIKNPLALYENTLVDGYARLEIAKALKMESVPVKHLTPDEAVQTYRYLIDGAGSC